MDLASLTHDEWEETYQRERLKAKRLSDIALGDLPKPPALVHGLLLDKTLTMLSAEPYSGKTLLSLALAIALDASVPLLGQYHVRERKHVLFVGQDAPSWDYAEQARKLLIGYGIPPESSQFLDIDLMLNTGLDLMDPASLRSLQDWHAFSPCDVLILDTLASLHSGDENATRDMSIVSAILKTIRNTFNCAILFTHHTAKPSQGVVRSENYSARGNSVLVGSIDFHLHLRRQGHTNRINMIMAKGRGSGGMDRAHYFDILEEAPSGVESVQLISPPPAFDDTTLLAALASGPKTRKELCAIGHPVHIDNALTRLSRAARIKKSGRATWSLA